MAGISATLRYSTDSTLHSATLDQYPTVLHTSPDPLREGVSYPSLNTGWKEKEDDMDDGTDFNPDNRGVLYSDVLV